MNEEVFTMTDSTLAPQVSVRLATDADLAALEARESEGFKGHSRKSLESQKAGHYYFALGLVGDDIAGHAALDCDPENALCPELRNMWVYPEHRRKGVGAAMSSFLEELAADQGFEAIYLGVTPDNPAAIPLYIGLDYTPTGEHRDAANLMVLRPDGDFLEVEENYPAEAIYRKSLKLIR